jgi:probable rRNA maturation factor
MSKPKTKPKPKTNISIQYAYSLHKHMLPRFLLKFWVNSTLNILNIYDEFNINIRFVDNTEGRKLNLNYRQKDYATNVLTFNYEQDFFNYDDKSDVNDNEYKIYNSDIILSCDVLSKEAAVQNKAIIAHYAHLIIHGVLHVLGYDHETDDEHAIMHGIECKILAHLGFL